MEDPRLAQALMAMQGGKDRLKLREEDMLQAEVGGRMKRRRPVQRPSRPLRGPLLDSSRNLPSSLRALAP